MDNIFKAINLKKTKVILLGDKDQLPSVEAGAILADLIPDKLENSSKISFGSLSFEIEKSARISGNENLGKIIKNLSLFSVMFVAQIWVPLWPRLRLPWRGMLCCQPDGSSIGADVSRTLSEPPRSCSCWCLWP